MLVLAVMVYMLKCAPMVPTPSPLHRGFAHGSLSSIVQRPYSPAVVAPQLCTSTSVRRQQASD